MGVHRHEGGEGRSVLREKGVGFIENTTRRHGRGDREQRIENRERHPGGGRKDPESGSQVKWLKHVGADWRPALHHAKFGFSFSCPWC